MISLFQSIILGVLQGAGEFLPISSTAHLILAPYFFGWPDPGLAFDVALHGGTLLAVLAFFWRDWIKIFKSAWSDSRNHGIGSLRKNILFYLVIATIPGVLFGLLFEGKAETIFRSPLLISLALILAGAVLFWADKKFSGAKNLKNMGWVDALIIGLSQSAAIIPGVSRSGATISAGLFRNFDRQSAARFSFLLSTPIIAGAAVLKLPELFRAGIDASILLGILSSSASGYLAIKYLLKFLEKYGFSAFFWYRLALGALILVIYFWR